MAVEIGLTPISFYPVKALLQGEMFYFKLFYEVLCLITRLK